jgi:hypothetical protein
MSAVAAALWSCALVFLVEVCVGITEAARPGAATDAVNRAACEMLATSIAVFLVVRVHARDVSLRQTLGVRPIAPLHVMLSVAAGAGLHPLLVTVEDWVLRRFPYSDAEREAMKHYDRLFDLPTHGARIALVLYLFVIMPLAKEVFFRGALYGTMKRVLAPHTVLLATSVYFACAYLDPRLFPAMFVLGLAMGHLRERSGTMLAPAIAQLAYWAVEGVPILRGRDPNADLSYPPRWIFGGAVIALLALAGMQAGTRTGEA